ncbi:(Fe-S)-binding protein [Ferrovum sp. PN-J185]|uniref:(Fe-S)-binding protein n=1 Tax=Ferrovum sp. PN-J185 TaxID=1356306 RepID=UPI000797DE3F|nr:(Fe-S)-binding protein [Ferrovum sp. PN-J185]KXW55453.1 lactate utilization protein A [Ferrovum sp. PN-J185]MCC6068448.1 (Fe-S)-binding protein [Ferrovum sp. PN-J185]MDE1891555.1 (Fe-S)-binding protein [Betaproteobacteria bacterium]MDE2055889.1 (Fe-S)-binding protein [Betaproteobacteria bacterium]
MKVGLFVTCLIDMMRPSIGFSAIELLQNAGCEVVVPDNQTCCGQPGFNSGDRESGRTLAKRFVELFNGCDYVVVPSGSCTGMIRIHYQDLFPENSQLQLQINTLAQRTYELTDFLVNVLKVEIVPNEFKGTVTYHDSCSGLRELNIKHQPRKLLESMNGLTLKEMDQAELCCGFGGTFSVKLGDIATRMADNKCHYAQQSGAEVIVGGDLGCLLNIEGRLRRMGDNTTQVKHVAEILTHKGK